MATATQTFNLTEFARVDIDGNAYVVYGDGQGTWAVYATAYDDVGDETDYSLWCCGDGQGVGDPNLCARIAAAAGLRGMHCAGGGQYVDAAR